MKRMLSNPAAHWTLLSSKRLRQAASRNLSGTLVVASPRDLSGLAYLNNRYHDPTTNQFISVDPLVTTTGEPYIYGAANPITYSDPDGLCAWSYIQELGCYRSPGGNTASENLAARQEAQSESPSITAVVGGVASELDEHVTASYSGCLFVCVGVSYQDGHLMPSVGEFGFSANIGPSIGWATKPADERESASVGGHVAFVVGTGGRVGIYGDEPRSDGVDYEQYVAFGGLGVSFGPAKSWSFRLW